MRARSPGPPAPEGRGLDRRGARTRRLLLAHGADSKREIASLTKLMTAHLALRYVPLGTVAVTGPDAVAVGESSVPLALGETQTVRSLLAALIVHSANDAAVVLAHATMDQPAAQAAAIKAARAAARRCPAIRSRASSC